MLYQGESHDSHVPLLSGTSKEEQQIPSNRRPLIFSKHRQHAFDKPDVFPCGSDDTEASKTNKQDIHDVQATTSKNLSRFTPSTTTSVTWGLPTYCDDASLSKNSSSDHNEPESSTIKQHSNHRRSSLVKTLSFVSDFVTTAANIATSNEKETPSIEALLQKQVLQKQRSADYVKDSELNQRIETVTLELLSYYREQNLLTISNSKSTDNTDFYATMKNLITNGAGRVAFWIVVSVLAVLTFKDVTDLVKDYSTDPTQSDMSIIFNESMTMPNITFCMSRSQAWSHFAINPNETTQEWDLNILKNFERMLTKELFLNSSWDYRMILEAYDVVATLTSIEKETTPSGAMRSIKVFAKQKRLETKRIMIKKWLSIIKDRGVTIDELTQKVGSETIQRSLQQFQRTTYDENVVIETKFRTSWISMIQFCFQPWFDQDNFYPIKDQGNFFTMILSHNSTKLAGKQIECMSVDFHGRPSSLSRFTEGKGRIRDGFDDELCPGMVHDVTVEVRAQYIMLENDDIGTACNTIEPGEDTEFDCRSRCRMNMLRELCNCIPLTLSHLATSNDLVTWPLCDYTQCVINPNHSNLTDETCTSKCKRDCNQIRYNVKHETKGRSVRSDLTSITLKYGRFDYSLITEKSNVNRTEMEHVRILDSHAKPHLVHTDIHRSPRGIDRNVARIEHSESPTGSELRVPRGKRI